MSEFLSGYERLEPTTWAYLSAILIIALFFKFNRILSVRNLDLILLLLLAPGLICVRTGIEDNSKGLELFGYWWLFGVNAILLLRALWDSAMVRRPLLEPNMNASGLLFLAFSVFLFLMANVITGSTDESDLLSAQRAQLLSDRLASDVEATSLETHGPGFPLLFSLPAIPTSGVLGDQAEQPANVEPATNGENGESSTTNHRRSPGSSRSRLPP